MQPKTLPLPVLLALVSPALAFPWVALQPGVDSSALPDRYQRRDAVGGKAECPNNPNHTPAAPITSQYPYLGAVNGKEGKLPGGIRVPAEGDTAHYFEAPGPLDIRGPCPGLNTAANHHFLSHDGITTFNELVDAQQNLYNTGYGLAILLATAGVGLTGDLISGKMSLGCDASDRTSSTGGLLGDETGLDGHNKFEGDTSLTRNDYFLANGDDFSFNGTLFSMMANVAQNNFSLDQMAEYRYQRYQQSVAENGQFFFGPGALLLYGAASFLYTLFPTNNGPADLATQESFFGAEKQADGSYKHVPERIPENWSNRAHDRSSGGVGGDIVGMYLKHPVLFGGNVGPNNFLALNYSSHIINGKLQATDAKYVTCLLYEVVTTGVPTSISNVYQLPAEILSIAVEKLAPGYANLGCPTNLFPKTLGSSLL